MRGGEVNPHPIQLLVNYWEIQPSLMGARLDELLRAGVTHLATFVPWQAVESDIAHTLARFLQALADRKMTVSLILTPEVGVHYPNSGLPKDTVAKSENAARHAQGGEISVLLPPNAFALPSLASPEFNKRYHNFLSRIDNLMADLGRNQPHLIEGVTAVLTGSFWKYYRSSEVSAGRPFDGAAGDYSSSSAVVYRQKLEQFFNQREFADPNVAAANRWKTRNLEEVNRRWFYQQSEDVFRHRSTQFIRRKATAVPLEQVELYTPEADPGVTYSSFLQMVSGAHADFSKLVSLVDEAAVRIGLSGETLYPPYIHWTGMGGFRTLSDAERQFLILRSLLAMGGQGGGILIDEAEWFSLSQAFRSRAEGLARLIAHGELKLKHQALYLTSHLWSGAGILWEEMVNRVGFGASMIASVDRVLRERDARLLVVDPACILTRESIQKLAGWARAGRVVALPRSPLYTESARAELEQTLSLSERMDISLGISYRLHALGKGKVLLYDLPEGLVMRGESLGAWQRFLASALSVSGIHNPCRVSDGRLSVIPLEKEGDGIALFILNGSSRPVAADVLFPCEVTVSDLAATFSSPRKTGPRAQAPASNRFSLEVPPCGILPLAVEGIGQDVEERRAAALTSDLMKSHVEEAAVGELPGFDRDKDIQSLWN